MRRSGCGTVVLVADLRAALAGGGDARLALRNARASADHAAALRERLRPYGVSVVYVAPRDIAVRLAARLGEPRLLAANPDRIADRVQRGLRRGEHRITAPASGAATFVQALLQAPARARRPIRSPHLPAVTSALDETAVGPVPLAGTSAPGD
jgi:hypothetical protein